MDNIERLRVILSVTDKLSPALINVDENLRRLKYQVQQHGQQIQASFMGLKDTGINIQQLIEPAIEAEAAGLKFQATMGGTAQDAERFKESVHHVNKATLGTYAETAKVYQTVAKQTKISGTALENVTTKVMMISELHSLDHNELTNAMTVLDDNFAGGFDKAADVVAFLARKGRGIGGGMLETVKEYSAELKTAGVKSMEEIATLVGAGLQTWNTEKAGDALKEGVISLFDMGKEQVSALKSIGLDDLQAQLVEGSLSRAEAMHKIGKAIAKTENTSIQDSALKNIFGTPGEDLGRKEMLTVLQAIGDKADIGGAYDKLAATYQQNPLASLEKYQGSLKQLHSTLSSLFLPALATLMDKITPLVEAIVIWTKENPTFSKWIMGSALAVTGLTEAITKLSNVVRVAKIAMAALTIGGLTPLGWAARATGSSVLWLVKGLSLLPGAILGGFGKFAILLKGVGAIIAAIVGLPGILVVAVGAAIAAVGILIWKNWEAVKGFFIMLGKFMVKLSPFYWIWVYKDKIINWISTAIDQLLGLLSVLTDALASIVPDWVLDFFGAETKIAVNHLASEQNPALKPTTVAVDNSASNLVSRQVKPVAIDSNILLNFNRKEPPQQNVTINVKTQKFDRNSFERELRLAAP